MFENALWFFSGALLYRALSTILGITVYKTVIQECYDYLLVLCDSVNVDFQKALNKKRDYIELSVADEKEKQKIYKSDNSFRAKWQATVISNLDSSDRLKELKDNLDKLNR